MTKQGQTLHGKTRANTAWQDMGKLFMAKQGQTLHCKTGDTVGCMLASQGKTLHGKTGANIAWQGR